MESEKHILRRQALINPQEYMEIQESLRLLQLKEIDYVSIANILVKRKSSVEESALKGILKQQGIPVQEIQAVLTAYLKNRKQMHGRQRHK